MATDSCAFTNTIKICHLFLRFEIESFRSMIAVVSMVDEMLSRYALERFMPLWHFPTRIFREKPVISTMEKLVKSKLKFRSHIFVSIAKPHKIQYLLQLEGLNYAKYPTHERAAGLVLIVHDWLCRWKMCACRGFPLSSMETEPAE